MNYKFILLLLLLPLAACGSDHDEVEPAPDPTPGTEEPSTTLSHDDVPSWSVIESTLYDNSMSLVINAKDLPATPATGDKIAAFVGESCRGLQTTYTTIGSEQYYLLSVKGSQDDTSVVQVTLRFYSADRQHIYSSSPFNFSDNAMMGQVGSGYQPTWQE